jgi:NAD(P)-dependent dehydrogenase (short-subunit alcohol dehydrogenase family)
VTGAGGGLGRAHALYLGSRGCRVVVNDFNLAAADAVVKQIQSAGGTAISCVCSVENAQEIVHTALKLGNGKIEILVNNAGILRDKSFLKMTEQEWDAVQAIHVHAAFRF